MIVPWPPSLREGGREGKDGREAGERGCSVSVIIFSVVSYCLIGILHTADTLLESGCFISFMVSQYLQGYIFGVFVKYVLSFLSTAATEECEAGG